MKIDAPDFLRELCAVESVRPFSHYVQRSPWGLRTAHVEETFLDRSGLYCFWWSGPRGVFLERISRYTYAGEPYPVSPRPNVGHDFIPAYVGMTAMAARRVGGRLKGRMIDRLVRFPTGMTRWLSSPKEARLVRRLSGTSGNFELFDYPERIRARLAISAGMPDLSLAAAQDYLNTRQAECRGLIAEFLEDYCSLLFDNYSISFVPFTDEVELFYAEALAIGLLRPCLNHN
jgi:hypothetical protein